MGLVACGGGSSGGSAGGAISSAPLAGTINGQAWTFADGQTDHFLSQGSSTFFAILYDQAIPATSTCMPGDPPGTTRSLILNIPMKVGQFPLSIAFNQTFSYASGPNNDYQNDVATSGLLEVTDLSATMITGGVKMAFGAKDSVDGQFAISICAK
jgi:hypothetical protein